MKRRWIPVFLTITLCLTVLTGLLLHPMKDSMAVGILHGVSGLLFAAGCVCHVLSYQKKRRRERRHVS